MAEANAAEHARHEAERSTIKTDEVHGTTWEALSALLTKLGEDYDVKVHRMEPSQGPEAVAMHIVPVAWFVAMRFTSVLNLGTYESHDNFVVGSEPIPLAELIPDLVRERVDAAVAVVGPELVLHPEMIVCQRGLRVVCLLRGMEAYPRAGNRTSRTRPNARWLRFW